MSGLSSSVHIHRRISEIGRDAWNACADAPGNASNPFVLYDFLDVLEESGCVSARTGWACPLTLAEAQVFAEPEARVHRTPLDAVALGWSEARFWDAYAEHYARPPLSL